MSDDIKIRDEFAAMEDELNKSQEKIVAAFQYIRDARKALKVPALAVTEKQRADVVAEAQALTDVAVKTAAAAGVK